MAQLTGRSQVFSGDTSVVDTTAVHTLGTRAFDKDGNEYIYLTGVASTAAGSWVSFDEAHITILTVANAKGRVAIAMAAIVASRYGWYQIYGKNTIGLAIDGGGAADNANVWVTATAGRVDDADVATDLVTGAVFRGAEASGIATFELNYPFCHNAVLN